MSMARGSRSDDPPRIRRRRRPPGLPPDEHVLVVPARLTKSAYGVLLEAGGEGEPSPSCAVARPWHLEGRFGSRTHAFETRIGDSNGDSEATEVPREEKDCPASTPTRKCGIPVLLSREGLEEVASLPGRDSLRALLETDGVEVVVAPFISTNRMRAKAKSHHEDFDARLHPERAPLEPARCGGGGGGIGAVPLGGESEGRCGEGGDSSPSSPLFTYAELFGGIGGFGVALEALGGRCAFYSEVLPRCRETYRLNFEDTPESAVHGDIYEVPDSSFPRDLDLLVGGFPCQPFSALGNQPGMDCDKGRGLLYLQIVRALKLSRPRAFLLENVPGLKGMTQTYDLILESLRGAGYDCHTEVCSSRGLTSTSRKRLFFVGIRNDLLEGVSDAASDAAASDVVSAKRQKLNSSQRSLRGKFTFPYVPDLKIRAGDVLDYDSLPAAELDILGLSKSTWDQLVSRKKRRWQPCRLAWPDRTLETLTSHYGNAVGRGESQLVPLRAPNRPRRFSVRECARIMGFPESFRFCPPAGPEQGDMAHRKEGYRMVGNAVCPPLVAALAGSVLDAAGVGANDDWTSRGRSVAVNLALAAMRPDPVDFPAGCSLWEYVDDGEEAKPPTG